MPVNPPPFEVNADLQYLNPKGWETVQPTTVRSIGRWQHTRRRVVEKDGVFFAIATRVGNTEYQEDDEEVEVYEVTPIQVTDYVRRT